MAEDECAQVSCFFFILGDSIAILWIQLIYVLTPRIILSLIVNLYCFFQVQLHLIIDKIIVKFHPICKRGALLPLALEPDCTTKLLNDLLWNNESKANTTSVNFLGALNKSEKFEQLAFIFPLYTQTRVFYLDLYIWFAIQFVERIINRHGPIFLRKFKCIRLNIQEHLLETPPISFYHQRLIWLFPTTFEGEIVIK